MCPRPLARSASSICRTPSPAVETIGVNQLLDTTGCRLCRNIAQVFIDAVLPLMRYAARASFSVLGRFWAWTTTVLPYFCLHHFMKIYYRKGSRSTNISCCCGGRTTLWLDLLSVTGLDKFLSLSDLVQTLKFAASLNYDWTRDSGWAHKFRKTSKATFFRHGATNGFKRLILRYRACRTLVPWSGYDRAACGLCSAIIKTHRWKAAGVSH